MNFVLVVLLWAILALASTTLSSSTLSSSSTSTSTSTTWVWATGTNSAGVSATTESAYTQTFSSFYSVVASPSSGSVGMGLISGLVGDIRSYSVVTVNGTPNSTPSVLNLVGLLFAALGIVAW